MFVEMMANETTVKRRKLVYGVGINKGFATTRRLKSTKQTVMLVEKEII